jgi:hypothetical protein
MRPSHPLYLFISCACMLIFSCCQPEYLTESELIEYVTSSESYSKTIESGQTSIKVTFRPTDLLAAQELRRSKSLTSQEVQNARAKYKNHYYFIVAMSRSGGEILPASSADPSQFSDMLQTVSFRMGEIVTMTTPAQDTIHVADYVYNRTFGMSTSTDLLFVFEKSKAQGHEWVQITFDEFGLGIGKQALRFRVSDLEDTPRIFNP